LPQLRPGQQTDSFDAIPSKLRMHIDWLQGAALPFWHDRAAAPDGLFFETLHLDGSPDPDRELRLRTGMRQVYVFAEAAYLGLTDFFPAVELAEEMARKLRGIAWRRDGRPGWVARFLRDGTVTDPKIDLYDHAFAVLGLSTLLKVRKSDEIAEWIAETCAVIDGFASEFGGWDEDDRCTIPRRQNPHMHLFEASLARMEAFGEPADSARAWQIFRLFRDRFFSESANYLTEFFGPRWEIGREYDSDRHDPGHMSEWIALLRKYSELSGVDVDRYCTALLQRVLQITSKGMRFLPDEIDRAGRPILNRRRLWLQTEFLKALVVEAEFDPSGALAELAERFCERLHETYLAGVPEGTWCDQFDLISRPTAGNIPASTLYHLMSVAPTILRFQNAAARAGLQPRLAEPVPVVADEQV
jgi:mannose-6-phosphate isomerase